MHFNRNGNLGQGGPVCCSLSRAKFIGDHLGAGLCCVSLTQKARLKCGRNALQKPESLVTPSFSESSLPNRIESISSGAAKGGALSSHIHISECNASIEGAARLR